MATKKGHITQYALLNLIESWKKYGIIMACLLCCRTHRHPPCMEVLRKKLDKIHERALNIEKETSEDLAIEIYTISNNLFLVLMRDMMPVKVVRMLLIA